MPLPTQKTQPDMRLQSKKVLLYGSPKVGKSTFCSHLPNALFLATEPGLDSLSRYEVPITSWDDILDACADIAAGDHQYQTIIIDTIDNAWRYCTAWICKKHRVEYEGDLQYGKGSALVNTEFHRVITKMSNLPYGLWMISHAKSITVEGRSTKDFTKTVPTVPDRARNVVVAMADFILYCSMDEKMKLDKFVQTRTIHTKPNLYFEAGDRTGLLPEEIPMDCEKFMACFDPFASDVMPVEMEAMVSISPITEASDGTISVDVTAEQPTQPTTDTDMADIDALDAILPKPAPGTSTRTRKQ